MPEYKDGQKINYTISEDAVDGYITSIKGYDLVNSHTPKETSTSPTKADTISNDDKHKQINPQVDQKTPVKTELPSTGTKREDSFKLSCLLLLLATTSMILAYKQFRRAD